MAKRKTSTAQVAETLTEEKAVSGGAFRAWLNVYKNIFNFKGRTSRFEFWSFQLVNSFVMVAFWIAFYINSVMLQHHEFRPHPLLTISNKIIIGGLVFYFITNLSLFVRRLHDAGIPAWKGYCKPWICCFALFFAFMLVGRYCKISEVLVGLSLYLYLYYVVKVFITAGWAQEDCNALEGQEPRYIDIEHKKRTMKYATIWFTILAFVILTMIILFRMIFAYSV
ncbi:MAG: DUF805 domain-containing protein [Alphaproteobacteria bacterium]|nr:DUF805 domain-containing protein [Alphaproteobacteria bacterium]